MPQYNRNDLEIAARNQHFTRDIFLSSLVSFSFSRNMQEDRSVPVGSLSYLARKALSGSAGKPPGLSITSWVESQIYMFLPFHRRLKISASLIRLQI